MDIYDIHDNLIETFSKEGRIADISLKFNSLKNNADKVKLIKELLCEYKRIPDLERRKSKSDNFAESLRQSGNKHFVLKGSNYFKALEYYNQSICFANVGSESLSIGYANRSAIYFEYGLYDKCLKNIQLARSAGYPKRLMQKLDKRETDCKYNIINILKSEEIVFEPKLSLEPNSKIPFIVDCLEMKETQELGRYIITNKEIKPGQILVLEEGYFNVLNTNLRYQRCANCMSENSLSLIPCEYCTSAMFCNQECYNAAQNSFHQFECPIIDYLFSIFNKIHLSAIRAAIKAVLIFDPVDKISSSIKDIDQSQINAFSMDQSKDISNELKYMQLYSLATNEEKRSPSDLFQRATIAAVVYHILIEYTKLAEILKKQEDRDILIELIFRYLQTSATNFHSLDLVETEFVPNETYCSGAYPLCSLINHSCAPNISRVSFGTIVAVFALKVIKQNEQLFDNYGFHHCLSSRSERISALKLQYNFTCNCLACKEDFPTFFNLRNPMIPDIVTSEGVEQLSKFNKKYALDNLERFCNYLEKYDKYYPCAQVCGVQEQLKMAFSILAGNVPFSKYYK